MLWSFPSPSSRRMARFCVPEHVQLQLRLDGNNYTTVHQETSFVADPGGAYVFDFRPQMARYLRVEVTESNLHGLRALRSARGDRRFRFHRRRRRRPVGVDGFLSRSQACCRSSNSGRGPGMS